MIESTKTTAAQRKTDSAGKDSHKFGGEWPPNSAQIPAAQNPSPDTTPQKDRGQMDDRAEGFYWAYVKDENGSQWDVLYWTGSAWQGVSNDDVGTIESVGQQLQPPETGSIVRPPGAYWIQLKSDELSKWQVAYWNTAAWCLFFRELPGPDDQAYFTDDGNVLYLGPRIEPPA
jgi:hypothetical protein